MRNSLALVITAALAVVLFSVVCAEKPSAQKSPRQAYDSLMEEVKELENRASAGGNVRDVITKIEGKFKGFIEEYPEAAEADDAKFRLGLLYTSTNQPRKAIEYLSEFVSKAPETGRRKSAYAHFYLAESYKKNGDYEPAKGHYRIVVDQYADVNPRLLTQAKVNLEDIDVLARLATGSTPLPFDVTDIKGKRLSLDMFKGKVVLLDFWATWCVPCRVEMPNVKKIYKRYHGEGFEIIGISLDQDRKNLESYIKRNDIKWPQYFDGKGWNNRIAEKYRIKAIPETFLLDRKGRIRYRSVRGAELVRAIEKLIGEK